MFDQSAILFRLPFAAVRGGRWYWELGDPDLGAVLVTGLYFLVAVACLLKARRVARIPRPPETSDRLRSEAAVWWILTMLMFCLGINKQADLQSLLTLYGRDAVRQAGLYDVRRIIQGAFILGIALAAFFSVALSLWFVRELSWPSRAATAGLGVQVAFVVIRAASFHHIDRLLGIRIADLKVNLILESIGLVVILLAAMAALPKGRNGSVTR